MRPGAAVLLLVLASTGQGCSAIPPSGLAGDPEWTAVGHIPLRLQRGEEDCGAAALAMVLARWGRSEEVCRPLTHQAEATNGLRAGTLRDAARGEGLQAFLVQGTIEDLKEELSLGHPVLVGLIVGEGQATRSHYEVVAGMNASAGTLLLADPAHGWRQASRMQFQKEWELAGRVTLLVFPVYP